MNLPMMNVLFVFGICGLQTFEITVEMAKLLVGKITAQVFGEFFVLDKRSIEGNFIPRG